MPYLIDQRTPRDARLGRTPSFQLLLLITAGAHYLLLSVSVLIYNHLVLVSCFERQVPYKMLSLSHMQPAFAQS